MKVEQIYEIVNDVQEQILGTQVLDDDGNVVTGATNVLQQDLSNIVDVGREILNLTSVDNYVRKLNDRIAKTLFVNRPYAGTCTSVLMDAWEYGAIVQKIAYEELPEAEENPAWNLQNGQSYDYTKFTSPKVSAKFFGNKTTFQIPMSFPKEQVKSAFSSASELNAFYSMIETGINTSATVKTDLLIASTINNFTAGIIKANNPMQSVNLLKMYNEQFPEDEQTVISCLTSPEFIRYATMQISLWSSRMIRLSKLFNVGGKDRFSSYQNQHMIALDVFTKASKMYLESDTYNKEEVALPKCEEVPYWQACGNDYSFDAISKIYVKNGEMDVQKKGILAIIFDRNALGVSNVKNHNESIYNPVGEFFNNWYKYDAGYFNDFNENGVVFYVEETE